MRSFYQKLLRRIQLGAGILAVLSGGAAHAIEDGVPLRGFTDISEVYDSSDDSHSFRVGVVDFFLAKPLDKNVNFLMELAFEPHVAGVTMDLERSYLQYTVNPWIKIAAGRFHTALGYWNETYHHGAYLHTSVTRPVMERFEDGGGLLPTHTTGIEARGNGLVGGANIGYILNFGNGRGPAQDPPSMFYSYNKTHSISGIVYGELANGLRFGPAFYTSALPGGNKLDEAGSPAADRADFPNGRAAGQETIYGFHLVFNSPEVEFMSEYANILHEYGSKPVDQNPDGSRKTAINALYAQLGYHFGMFTPYARYEIHDTDHPDAYLAQLVQGVRYYTAGVRYELTSASALKFEYNYMNNYSGDHQWNTNLNWSFGW